MSIVDSINRRTIDRMIEGSGKDFPAGLQLPIDLFYDAKTIRQPLSDIRAKYDRTPLLMDLGCSGGTFLLRAYDEGYNCVGVDIEPNLLIIAQKGYNEYKKASAKKGDFRLIRADFTTKDSISNLSAMKPDISYVFQEPVIESLALDAASKIMDPGSLLLWHPTSKLGIATDRMKEKHPYWSLEDKYVKDDDKGFLLYTKSA
jgi:SAM-dependent methyltransferase